MLWVSILQSSLTTALKIFQDIIYLSGKKPIILWKYDNINYIEFYLVAKW